MSDVVSQSPIKCLPSNFIKLEAEIAKTESPVLIKKSFLFMFVILMMKSVIALPLTL